MLKGCPSIIYELKPGNKSPQKARNYV